MIAATAATGARAGVATWKPSWLTPRVLRFVTMALIAAAFVVSSFGLAGSG
jgi:hypothetical protein